MQHRFNLSDPAVEEALYDSRAMRDNFARIPARANNFLNVAGVTG